MKPRTTEECRKMIFNCGIKFGVSPKLISNRLLSDLDKADLLEGKISNSSLEAFVEVWKQYGMPDYANGKTESYASEMKRLNFEEKTRNDQYQPQYRKPFID